MQSLIAGAHWQLTVKVQGVVVFQSETHDREIARETGRLIADGYPWYRQPIVQIARVSR